MRQRRCRRSEVEPFIARVCASQKDFKLFLEREIEARHRQPQATSRDVAISGITSSTIQPPIVNFDSRRREGIDYLVVVIHPTIYPVIGKNLYDL